MGYVYAAVPVNLHKFLRGEPPASQDTEALSYVHPRLAERDCRRMQTRDGYQGICIVKFSFDDEKIQQATEHGVVARTTIPFDKILEANVGVAGNAFGSEFRYCTTQPEATKYLQPSDWNYVRAQIAEGANLIQHVSADVLKDASVRDELNNCSFRSGTMFRNDVRNVIRNSMHSDTRFPGLPNPNQYYWNIKHQFDVAARACEGDTFAKLGAGLRAMCEYHNQQVCSICPAAHTFTPAELLQTYLQEKLPKISTREINFPSDAHAYAFTQCLMLPDEMQQATFDAFCKKYAERQQEGMDTKAVASLFKQCANETQHLVDTTGLNSPDTPDIDDIEQNEVL